MPDPDNSSTGLKLTDTLLSALAREVARNIYPTPDIRDQLKLTIEEFDIAVETPYFQQRLAEEVSLWNDPKNVDQRIKLKAGTMLEQMMPEYYNLVHDPTQPMSAKVAALQQFARMAGVENNAVAKGDEAGDRRVKITINIGGQKLEYDKEQAKLVEGEVLTLEGKDGNRV